MGGLVTGLHGLHGLQTIAALMLSKQTKLKQPTNSYVRVDVPSTPA
jgi:hypothetical protein